MRAFLETLLSTPERLLVLQVPCPNLVSPHWHIDIADDYLAALLVGETLAQYCNNIEVDFESTDDVSFALTSQDIIDSEKFVDKLVWLGKGFGELSADVIATVDGEFEDGYDDDYAEFQGAMADLSDEIDTRCLHFPELGDKYMANMVIGIEEISGDDEEFETMYLQYPERRHGYWRSCISSYLGYDLYGSIWAWILPHDLDSPKIEQDVATALVRYGGFDEGTPILEAAQLITIGNLPPIVLNRSAMACYPLEGVREAQDCVAAIWNSRFQEQHSFVNGEAAQAVHNLLSGNTNSTRNKISVRLSEDGYILIVQDLLAQYVFFKQTYNSYRPRTETDNYEKDLLGNVTGESRTLWEVPTRSQTPFWEAVDKFSEVLGQLEGNPVEVKLDWNEFNDEKFEQLCYDILRMSERFDPNTARKMGKSKSRDGGRDIEIFTRQRIGVPALKWVVQCKFSKGSSSLSGSKVVVSDVIDEHNAGGFCVMTNTLIDSTLHDKLESIARNRNVEVDEWDVLRIERTLARPRYRNVKKRYFDQ